MPKTDILDIQVFIADVWAITEILEWKLYLRSYVDYLHIL